jgi:hypothetical protein
MVKWFNILKENQIELKLSNQDSQEESSKEIEA